MPKTKTKSPPIPPPPPVDPEYEKCTTKSEKAKYFLDKAQEKVIIDLDQQKIRISTTKRPYMDNKWREEQQQQKIRKLQKEKSLAKSRLESIQQQQKEYKAQKIKQHYKKFLQSQNHRSINNEFLREDNSKQKSQSKDLLNVNMSTLSVNGHERRSQSRKSEDLAKLRRFRQEQKQFQRKMTQRAREYEERMAKLHIEERELEERRRKQRNETKRQALLKRLADIEERRKEKTQLYEQQKKRIIEIKAKKRSHQEMQRQFASRIEVQEQEKRRQLEERLKNRNIDVHELSEHSKRYEELMERQKAKRTEKMLDLRANGNQSAIENPQQSKYYTLVVQEDRKHKMEKVEKERQAKIRRQQAEHYAIKVKEQYAPKAKSQEDEDGRRDKNKLYEEKKPIPRKTFEEIKDIGNDYLLKSKKLMSKRQNPSKQHSIDWDSHTMAPTKKYKDYLEETRAQRKQKQGHCEKSPHKFDIYQREVEEAIKIMKKQGCAKDKIDRVKLLTQKIEQDQKAERGHKSAGLIKKIAAKIQILSVIK